MQGELLQRMLMLAKDVRCVNVRIAARMLGLDGSDANDFLVWRLLELLREAGRLKRVEVAGTAVVYCVPEAGLREAASALLAAHGLSEERVLKGVEEVLRSARGRRVCLSPASLLGGGGGRGAVRAVAAYLAAVLGGEIIRTSRGVRVCASTEEARRRLYSQPASGDGRVAVSVRLPKALAEALEELAGGGRSVDDVVAEALAAAVEKYRGPARGGGEKAAVTIYIEPELLRGLEELVRRGLYASVGEAVGDAVRLLLSKTLQPGPPG
jgi:Arc/MetJ-type ribon-helix-helix transcriptional regulator